MSFDEPTRKKLKLDAEHCIICFKTLNPKKDTVVQNPTSDGIRTIL